ncbi:MAG: leucyl aminopeptidase family protein [Gammaproteobacteria bacterium]|nr:leucyl aminopeptidase family protein [Gammaproteobacteria bacterium]
MIEFPEFRPLKISQSTRAATDTQLASLDHVVIVVPKDPPASAFMSLPQGKQLHKLLERVRTQGGNRAMSRLTNVRATGVTIAMLDTGSAFGALTWAREVLVDALRDRPRKLGVLTAGLDEPARARTVGHIVAAAEAAAFKLPSFKTEDYPRQAELESVALLDVKPRIELERILAEATGNNLARWLTAMPPNRLTAGTYRHMAETLAKRYSLGCKFIGEHELEKLGAGAFLAVAQGNAKRDAGMLRLCYRPRGSQKPDLTLIGKGVLFDTGGTNLKPFKGMLDMHTDMQGSAVALGTLIALVEMKVPYAVDAWLALTENRMSATGYKSQDVVTAANGTSIQVIHTDAEGRMVLADALALAARDEPRLIIDYATLTGTCVSALTQRYSGVFTNRQGANQLLLDAGAASGERVWPFPMDEDFDQLLRSDVADVRQCTVDSHGDHVLAARFLSRFVPKSIPWVHVDLSAGEHKGGLAHIPTDITGFGVRFTLELLGSQEPAELAARMAPDGATPGKASP